MSARRSSLHTAGRPIASFSALLGHRAALAQLRERQRAVGRAAKTAIEALAQPAGVEWRNGHFRFAKQLVHDIDPCPFPAAAKRYLPPASSDDHAANRPPKSLNRTRCRLNRSDFC
jgi:hypothetical protein